VLSKEEADMSFSPWEIMAFVVGACGFVLTVLNIIDKQHHFKQEADEPFNNLKARVDAHDVEINDIKAALKLGNDRFREQEETNATFKSVMLSFVNFEIAYCLHTDYPHTEELMDAKRELEQYLTGNNHEKKDRD
jgi:hypothetical protein